jgi:hypothetical protein
MTEIKSLIMLTPGGSTLHLLQHFAQSFVFPSGGSHISGLRGFGNSYQVSS